MHRIIIAISIIGLGCGEVTAEPIRSASLAITSVDIEAAASSDPYACDVTPVDPSDPGELVPFVTLGELGYAGTCQDAGAGTPSQCWYTADNDCASEGRECGGFYGQPDAATGGWQLSGGQHMICPHRCVADEQCPAGDTGTARPACMHAPEFNPELEVGQCMLACDSGETCPDGFVCVEPGIAFGASDGSFTNAPRQCVQLHRLTLTGRSTPR